MPVEVKAALTCTLIGVAAMLAWSVVNGFKSLRRLEVALGWTALIALFGALASTIWWIW